MSTKAASDHGVAEPKMLDTHVEQADDVDEKMTAADMKADAMEAEQAEQKMGVIEAVKAYPMAALWAFVMSCTIVCTTPTAGNPH